ncbi:MAG: D-aminoacyl-tRNA deacylase [Candidatus Peribacteria bacterium]|nr:MAG: D-aminoacyl-tRNA deacylase [Candidatus Peribacteria bacterium]
MTKSLLDIQGELLLISNFTLYGRSHKGAQIDRSHAAQYTLAEQRYLQLLEELQQHQLTVKS